MPTPACYPWWHAVFAPLIGRASIVVSSGCSVDPSTGNIPCAPEAMRAAAEAQLKRLAPSGTFNGSLSLETYSLARYMQSEVGNGTIEERVAVGEVGWNQARTSGRTVTQLVAPNGFYGPIHGSDSVCAALGYNCTNKHNVCCAPYGRWASSALDPTVLTLLLANLVATGQSGNFTQGAIDQDGPEAWIPQGQAALTGYVQTLASQGKYWVGPLPGIDHWRTFLQYRSNTPSATSALLSRGIAALTLPAQRPSWGTLPSCSALPNATPTTVPEDSTATKLLVGLALLGGLAGIGWLTWHASRRVAKRTTSGFSGGIE